MSDFLESMRASSLQRVRHAVASTPLHKVVSAALGIPKPPSMQPGIAGFDVIAEVKRKSPAYGALSSESADALVKRAQAYAQAGAIAVSVLTEPQRFGGELAHLTGIAHALRPLGVPVMRKDFIVDVYQVWEAAAAGAGGVLLIIRMVDDAMLMEMIEAAAQAKMFVLLEAFDEKDLLRARPFVGVRKRILLGLNARDLSTLEVDSQRLIALANKFPPNCLRVAESGISTAAEAKAVAKAGYALALVGTALMRAREPQALVADMLAAGREATQR